MHNSIKFSNIVFIFSYILITLFLLFICNIVGESILMNKLSKGFYTDNAITFSTNNTENLIEFLENSSDDFILYQTVDLNNDIRKVYYQGKIEFPPILEGRFFVDSDFENNNVSVIGKLLLDSIIVENEKSYIYHDNVKYEVIGIMGKDFSSSIDRTVFLASDIDNYNNRQYVLDQSSFKSVDDINEKSELHLKEIDVVYNTLDRFYKKESTNLLFYSLATILMLLSIFNYGLFWLDRRKLTITVKQIVGLPNRLIYYFIYINVIYLVTASQIIVLIIFTMIRLFSIYNFEYLNVIIYIIIVFSMYLISYCYYS